MSEGLLTEPFSAAEHILLIDLLEAGQKAVRTYQAECYRRGQYTFGPLEIRSGGPLGILFATRKFSQPTSLLVYPASEPVAHFALTQDAARPQPSRSGGRLGQDPRFRSIREFRSGDPRRQIHWRSSARLGRLVVKQFEVPDQPPLLLVLDTQAGHDQGQGKETSLEYVVKAAASLVQWAFDEGRSVELAWATDDGPAHHRPEDRWEALAQLAVVAANGQLAFPDLLSSVGEEVVADRALVVLLPLPRPEDVVALAELYQQGCQVTAVLADVASFTPGQPTTAPLVADLRARGIATYLLRQGESVAVSLAQESV